MKAKHGGFTIIELLTGILISGILLAGLYSVFYSQQVAFSAQEQVTEMNQNIRAALDLMTREIRLAGYKTSTSTTNGIQTATSDTIRILADLDQNGDTLGENEDITYTYDSARLQIYRIYRDGVNSPIADNVTNLSFSYTLADGSVTTSPSNPANIRKITISVTVQTTYPDRAGYRTITLMSDVTPRNLVS